MKYLLDANVWLDIVTSGPHWQESEEMIRRIPFGGISTTDFSVHTVGLVLAHREPLKFRRFLEDLVRHRVFTLHLAPSSLGSVLDAMAATGLDFDDAFQYIAAIRNELTIVSFDSDFDRTTRGRLTPAQVISALSHPPTP